jgi:hypothetical protein
MSETENAANCCLKTKTNWAFALSIISLALSVILITALIAGISCHKKKQGSRNHHLGCGGPAAQCLAGGFKHKGGPGLGEHRNFSGERQGGEKFADRLAVELSLDADQQAKLKQVFADQRAQIQKLGDQRNPGEVKKILEDGKAKIRAVLKPDQQKKFDDLAAKSGPKRNPTRQ